MNAIATPRQYTPEDLLTMPDGDRYELVDGQLVERNMGWEASWVGGRLFVFLATFCDKNSRGWVVPADASYQCYPDAPSKVRKPDVSFVRRERLSTPPKGHCPVAPNLVVEVVSPNDLYSDVRKKVVEYHRAGVSLVWIIDPETRSIHVHRADGSVAELKESDALDGEDVIPGFRCPLTELFAFPPLSDAPAQ